MKRIYLDNAASTPMTPEVIKAMQDAMGMYSGNPSSIHLEGRTARAKIEESRKTVAQLLNASIGEIFFTSGGTESNNTAIKCAVRDLGVSRIITTSIEHHAVTHSVDAMHKNGVEIIYIPIDHKGILDIHQLEYHIIHSAKPTLVTIMHVNNELGNINPIDYIAELCDRPHVYFHTDAVQSVGHLPIDLQKLKVHFLCASAHKFHGPKGIGFLFIRQGIRIHPLIDGGGQERNIRGGTESIHNIIGMSIALESAIKELDNRQSHIEDLKQYFYKGLLQINPDIRLNGDEDHTLYTVLSVSFPPGPKSELLLMQLDMAGISASGGSACTSGAEAASHVLQGIQHPEDR
ncbi:MAG: cysteine desulfurase family protein, partial [Saprospiraceae bacterium]